VQGATCQTGVGRFEHKSVNRRIEAMAILGHKKVTPAHGAARSMQATTTGVLKGFAGSQQGLLPDHAQAFDLFAAPTLVLDLPVPRNQLCRNRAGVGHGHGVGESKDFLQGIALLGHVLWEHINLNVVRGHLHMLTATITT